MDLATITLESLKEKTLVELRKIAEDLGLERTTGLKKKSL